MEMFDCPECGEELDFLDTVVRKATGYIEHHLYICHNEKCVAVNTIYNDRQGNNLEIGDPSGLY